METEAETIPKFQIWTQKMSVYGMRESSISEGDDSAVSSNNSSQERGSVPDSSWFKSLKRNLSSKRRGGKQARSGGNIAPHSQQKIPGGRLNKSEWDICEPRPVDALDLDLQNMKMSDGDGDVVSGLDLAPHQQQNKGNQHFSC